MVLKYISRVLCLAYLLQAVVGLTMVDDVETSIVYSNSGPSWWGSNFYNGQGKYVTGQVSSSERALNFTWHETVGDGAAITFAFTGTRVSLVSTICNSGYNTTINFYMDGEYKSQYRHLVPGPMRIESPRTSYVSDVQLKVTIVDFDGLTAGRHTFRAVSVGSDSLFVVDALYFEPADVVTTASPSASGSTTRSQSGSTTSSSSSSTTSHSTTQPTLAVPTIVPGNSEPIVASMDVKAADSRIVYSPPGAWKQYSNARRATSCLEGTMSSSIVGSSLTYNFTGSTIQLYTISAPNGGNYTISLDGVNQGTYSSYDASADPSSCPSKALFSAMALANTEHSLVLTVQGHSSGSNQSTVQFVGFRTSFTSTVNSSTNGTLSPNLGPIIGGVIGGIAGLVLLVFLVVWWMRRQRRSSEGSDITHIPDPSLRSPFTDDAPFSEARTRTVAGSSSSMLQTQTTPFTIPPYPPYQQGSYNDYDYTAAPPTQIDYHTGAAAAAAAEDDDASTNVDGLTYYTLPSYHERVRNRPAAQNLSNADVDAISRRLQEVMRQTGAGRNSLLVTNPPRELIDHFVEEQSSRQPKA